MACWLAAPSNDLLGGDGRWWLRHRHVVPDEDLLHRANRLSYLTGAPRPSSALVPDHCANRDAQKLTALRWVTALPERIPHHISFPLTCSAASPRRQLERRNAEEYKTGAAGAQW